MKKHHIVIAVIFVCSLLIIWKCIDFVRYRSFSKYNIWPAQTIENYLEKTYGGEFTLVSTDFYGGGPYNTWVFQYEDENDLPFNMYYQAAYDGPNGLELYLDVDRGERDIIDFYWQAKLNKEFEDELDLDSYNIDCDFLHDYTNAKYSFNIKMEKDIDKIAEIISTIYVYTYKYMKNPTYQILGCEIDYQGEFLCGISIQDEDYDYENIEKEGFKEYVIQKIKRELYAL